MNNRACLKIIRILVTLDEHRGLHVENKINTEEDKYCIPLII